MHDTTNPDCGWNMPGPAVKGGACGCPSEAVAAPIKIGCIVVIRHIYGTGFLGINCKKGRGRILPGGTYDPKQDRTYHDTAIRECQEETGITPYNLRYLWSGPDGGEYITFAFLADWREGTPRETNEGTPEIVTWRDLCTSHFAAYYNVLHQVYESKYRCST